MQDRYVGDIGDFVKLGILRGLQPGRRLGVAWWLYPDESHNTDGRHIGYLQKPAEWRARDPELFDGLSRIVAANDRRVAALEAAGVLPDAVFANEVAPTTGTPAERAVQRRHWLDRIEARLRLCDLVFVDPDNGFETANFSPAAKAAGKSVSLAELRQLSAPGRTLIVYHHQTRRPGGHLAELSHWGGRLREAGFESVDAIRAPRFSVRAFFLLDAPEDMRARAERLTRRWNGALEWHPGLR